MTLINIVRLAHKAGSALILACVTFVGLRASETIESHVDVTSSTYPALNLVNGSTNFATFRVDVANNIIDLGDLYSSGPSLGLRFFTNDFERLRITADGSVGIGTPNPQAKLQIMGDLYISPGSGSQLLRAYGPTSGFQLTDEGSYVYLRPYHAVTGDKPLQIGPGSGGIRVDGSGNVGVGTTSPLAKLNVFGMLRLDNGTQQSNYFATLSSRYDSSHPFSLAVENNTGGSASEVFGVYSPSGGGFLNPVLGLSGNVGIGTTNPTQKLSVNGTIRAKEVIVEASPWPDDVFEDGYKLKALSEVATHIEEHGHLPDVPNAAVVAEQGIGIGEMQATLLRKLEELTLYILQQERRIHDLERRLATGDSGRPAP